MSHLESFQGAVDELRTERVHRLLGDAANLHTAEITTRQSYMLKYVSDIAKVEKQHLESYTFVDGSGFSQLDVSQLAGEYFGPCLAMNELVRFISLPYFGWRMDISPFLRNERQIEYDHLCKTFANEFAGMSPQGSPRGAPEDSSHPKSLHTSYDVCNDDT